MAKKKFKPPKQEEVVEYVRDNNLCVDPWWWYSYFVAGDWIKSNGEPVRSWKQTLWTHHRTNLLKRGRPAKCSFGNCQRPGVYPAGRDDAGFVYFRCVNHKPMSKRLPANVPIPKMKTVPDGLTEREKGLRKNKMLRDLAVGEQGKS